MPSPQQSEVPFFATVARNAKARAFADLSPEERERAQTEMQAWRAAATERRAVRKAARRERVSRIHSLMLSGLTASEIASAEGRTPLTLALFMADVGIPFRRAQQLVLYGVEMTIQRRAALQRMARDYGRLPQETLADLVRFCLDDDAAVARRALRVQRQKGKPT